jgi:hypothetical protein
MSTNMSTENEDFRFAFEKGIDLFNAVEFVDAEEAFNEAAGVVNGDARELANALGHLAGAFHKVREGFPEGVMKSISIVTRQLARLPGDYGGVDLKLLLDGIKSCGEELSRGHDFYEEGLGDDQFPRIVRLERAESA